MAVAESRPRSVRRFWLGTSGLASVGGRTEWICLQAGLGEVAAGSPWSWQAWVASWWLPELGRGREGSPS